jgi:thiol-disulfide isomerase/thioredoxin
MRFPLLLIACSLILAACTGSGAEAGALLPPEEREAAPEVVAETLDGDELALADLDGGPVLVNFWASWCGPCIEEAPELRHIHDQYADRGVHVIGVNVRDRITNAQRFEQDHDIPYPSWQDPASEIAARFGGIGPAALPSTLILDRDHRVAVRIFGAVSAAQLRDHLDTLLAEQEAAP